MQRARLHLFVLAAGAVLSGCSAEPVMRDGVSESVTTAATSYDWLQFNGNSQHDGNNTQETVLGAANVGGLVNLFQVSLPSFVDNAPVALAGVATAGGTRDLLFVTTRAGQLLALDAHSGATVWSATHGAGSCHINNGSSVCYTTSTPAIDPGRAFVYSYGLDGLVHKHSVRDGSEITGGGWPELATTKPYDEKSSPALVWATAKSGAQYLYVANGGYPGDNGDYQGHITAINLADGSQHVFNTLCSDQAVHFVERPGTPDCGSVQAAVWARSGVVYDAARDTILLATGNGNFDGSHQLGDSILALHPDGTGAGGGPIDSYTPTNYQQLQNDDADIGSTAPVILPSVAGSRVAHLAVQSGKDANLRLVDRDNLSGRGGPGHTGGELFITGVPQGGEVLTAIAVWTRPSDNAVFIFVGNDNGLSALRVSVDGAGNPSLVTAWQHGGGRTSPLVANGVLYAGGANIVEALDPVSGARLWSSTQTGGMHWASPIVVNGVLYLADTNAHLTAWALPASSTLPPPWQTSDVGSVGHAGSASASNGSFALSGSGDDIWNTADAFRYVYQPLSGDGTITARVGSVGNTNAWAKAGVMFRETLAAGSRHALMAITPGNGAAFQRRVATGGTSTHTAGPSVHAPYWVRLVRRGDTLTGSVSSDGTSWTVVGSDTVPMAAAVFVGLALTAHDNTVLDSASFDQVSVAGTTTQSSIKVNFQLATTATPAGYLPDSGAAFGDRGNGFSYGWNADNSANARERNAANSPDKRYDTLAHLQKPSNPNASWQIALANGNYSVRIVSGDPSNIDSVYALEANGVQVVAGTPSASTHWFDGTATVAVSNGRLVVANGASASNNKICFVEITAQ